MRLAAAAWTVLLSLVAGGAVAAVHDLDAAELSRFLENRPDEVFLLDVRTPAEYRRGRIPGAILIPMKEVPDSLDRVPRDRKVVVVCASGARSRAVARYLDRRGYPWVGDYTGGVVDWYRRGLPLER